MRTRYVAIGSLIAILAVVNAWMGYVSVDFDSDDHLLMTMIFALLVGQYIGQLNLVSVWAAVSNGSSIVRLPWALLLAVAMWGSLVVGKWYAEDGYTVIAHDEMTILIGILLGYGCLVTQVPLWIASRVFGWRLVVLERDDDQISARFNLQQMFLGTVLLAAAMAIGRLILGDLEWAYLSILNDLSHFWPFLIPISFCNLLFVAPLIWATFLVTPTRMQLIGASILLTLVGPFELLAICLLLGRAPAARELPHLLAFFSMLNVGQAAVVYTALSILKEVAGFRLIRLRQRRADNG